MSASLTVPSASFITCTWSFAVTTTGTALVTTTVCPSVNALVSSAETVSSGSSSVPVSSRSSDTLISRTVYVVSAPSQLSVTDILPSSAKAVTPSNTDDARVRSTSEMLTKLRTKRFPRALLSGVGKSSPAGVCCDGSVFSFFFLPNSFETKLASFGQTTLIYPHATEAKHLTSLANMRTAVHMNCIILEKKSLHLTADLFTKSVHTASFAVSAEINAGFFALESFITCDCETALGSFAIKPP